MVFDIVIPLGPNEIPNIKTQLTYTKTNIVGFRNIYIICYDENIQLDGCIMVCEKLFQFNKNDLDNIFKNYYGSPGRNNWYYQQLLKLYAGFVCPDILNKYLVIDADVFFFNSIEFELNTKTILTCGEEYNEDYFSHMIRMHPSFTRQLNKSGISHHMLFNKEYVVEMINMVEDYHKMPFWIVFLKMVDESRYHGSGASEYEMYFHYMVQYHSDIIHLRHLNWSNKEYYYDLNQARIEGYDYISLCHWAK